MKYNVLLLSSVSGSGIEQITNMDVNEFLSWLEISKGVAKKCQYFQ
ncbi:hypothetical protein [Wolbachia endosymbiont of Pentalonia nigronervosa]|nr:hypothetical protein [Wolbachia endosymbiont of Pentalonia nigronervosa]